MLTKSLTRLRGQLAQTDRQLWLWPALTTICMIIVWEAFVRIYQVTPVVLPAPSAILRVFVDRYELLLTNLWPTFYQIVLGFALSVVGGVAVAIALTYSKVFERSAYPMIVVAQIVPKVAVAPLLVLWFGMGDLSRLALAFLVAFFPMVVNTAAGLAAIDSDTLRMARSYMGSRTKIFTKIRLPNALPHIFAGMKISITLAVIGVIVAEFVASQQGIGYLIIWSNGLLDTPMMFAAIILLSVVGLVLYGLIAAFEKLIVYWQT